MDDELKKALTTFLWLLALLLGLYIAADVLTFLIGLALLGRHL